MSVQAFCKKDSFSRACLADNLLSELLYSKADAEKSVNMSLECHGSKQDPFTLGTFEGSLHEKNEHKGDFEITLKSFKDNQDKLRGLTYSIKNMSGQPLVLDKLTLRLDSQKVLEVLDASSIENLNFVKQARQKNDIPGSFDLTKEDKNLSDAAFLSMNTEAGAGINFNEQDANNANPEIFSEPVLYIKNIRGQDSPGILLGALGQRKQLCDIIVQADDEKKHFEKFEIQFHFDFSILESGSCVESEWIIFMKEEDCWTAMHEYYECFARHFDIVRPPRPAPSIYCSWYFYGSSLTEKGLDENLEFLKTNPIPFDVFLLDLGWFDDMGLWEPNDKWPSGMAAAADKIKKAGYKPGIWTSPFVVMADSPIIQEHPELVAKDFKGEPVKFGFKDAPAYAIDPTCPYAEEYLTELFTRLKGWGYNYHKLDFLRSVEQDESIRFYDKTATRASAYVKGMSIIKEAVGDDGYIIACGGLFEASAGLVHAVRSGSDVRGEWYDNGEKKASYINRIKQNIFRNNHNRLWHTDPDALMLRLNDQPWKNSLEHHYHLSLGALTDEEAFTTVVNQFLGDGIVCLSERLKSIQADRLKMLKHVLPPVDTQTRPLDMYRSPCPSMFITKLKGAYNSLVFTVCNWDDQAKEIEMDLSQIKAFDRQAVFEFYKQQFYGVCTSTGKLTLKIPTHGSRVFRLTKVTDDGPLIIGTDLHITCGLLEVDSFQAGNGMISAQISSPWQGPVHVTALFDAMTDPEVKKVRVNTNELFEVNNPK